MDDILRVLQILEMFRRDLLVSDDLFYLLPHLLLDLGVVDEGVHHDAEGGGGGVEPREEEEDGGGHQPRLQLLAREAALAVVLVKLVNEDVNQIISLRTSLPEMCGVYIKTLIISDLTSCFLLFS